MTIKTKQIVIIKHYCEGGMKIIDVKAFIDALKIT